MTIDCSDVCRNLASCILLFLDALMYTISSVTNWRYDMRSGNHSNFPSGTCFWDKVMQSSILQNQRPLSHTDQESIFSAKLANSKITQSSKSLIPLVTFEGGGGMMVFTYTRFQTWFISNWWIFCVLASNAGTNWFWSSLPNWSSSASPLMIFDAGFCAMEMAGWASGSTTLTRLFILLNESLGFFTSIPDDAIILLTSKAAPSVYADLLMSWSHHCPRVLEVAVRNLLSSWVLLCINFVTPQAVLDCYPSKLEYFPIIILSLNMAAFMWSISSPVCSDKYVYFSKKPCNQPRS